MGGSNNDDDELFDMFMLDEIGKQTGGSNAGKGSSGGGCLTCLLFMIAVPVVIAIGVAIVI